MGYVVGTTNGRFNGRFTNAATPTNPSPLRVAIVDDHRAIREGLKRIVGDDERLRVAWAAHSGEEAIRLLASSEPDVLLLDLVLGDLDGLTMLQHAGYGAESGYAVVIVSQQADAGAVTDAIRAGIGGFVAKDDEMPDREFCNLICNVVAGRPGFSPSIYPLLVLAHHEATVRGGLTMRQLEITQAEANGLSDAEIYAELHISESTLRRERDGIRRQLNASSRSHAIAIAVRERLIS